MLQTGTFADTLSWLHAGKPPGGHFIGLKTPQRALMQFYSMEKNPRWDQFIVFCPLEGHPKGHFSISCPVERHLGGQFITFSPVQAIKHGFPVFLEHRATKETNVLSPQLVKNCLNATDMPV